MLELFVKTLTNFVDKSLSALLLGAAALLILIFQYWKVPEKWDNLNKQLEETRMVLGGQNKRLDEIELRIENIEKKLEKIDARQQRIFDFFKYSAGRLGSRQVPIDELNSGEFD